MRAEPLRRARRYALGAVLAALALAATAPAAADARSDGDLAQLKPGLALLLLPITSNADLERLTFSDPARELEFTVDDIVEGHQLVLLRVEPGSYHLRQVEMARGWRVDFQSHRRFVPKFEVRGGAINYAGDIEFDSSGNVLYTTFGGNLIDALPHMLARQKRIVPDLLARFPFVLAPPLEAKAVVGETAPLATWRHADWLANAPRLAPALQRQLAGEMFARSEGVLPELGAGWDAVLEACEKLPKGRAETFHEKEQGRMLVVFDGLWGDRGEVLAIDLWFAQDRLASLAIRSLDASNSWTLPAPDAWADLAAFAAGR